MLQPSGLLEVLRYPETYDHLEEKRDEFIRADGRSYSIIHGIPSLVFPQTLLSADANVTQTCVFCGFWLSCCSQEVTGEVEHPFIEDNPMNTETLVRSPLGKMCARVLAAGMESRFRYRFFGPENILQGVDGLQGHKVLELGCGTGFFTIPAAAIIGETGSLLSMDIVPESVEIVSGKAQELKLRNTRVVKGDALNTQLDGGSFDTVILFGVIPAPMVPLSRLLVELHRVLRPAGNLAVWPHVPGWLPRSILKSGLFALSCKRNGVYNFRRS